MGCIVRLLWAIFSIIQATSRTTGLPSLEEIFSMFEHVVRGHVPFSQRMNKIRPGYWAGEFIW